ncbi:MAG: stage III sporulation protein AE [Defluviitaleaceae bacterium]|nr:stage III sporulation protein AE [Defluviitaleaceae bacterium]
MIKTAILVIFLLLISTENVFAADLLEQMRNLDLREADLVIDHAGGLAIGRRESLTDVAIGVLRGDLDLSAGGLLNLVLAALFREVADLLYLMRIMLVVAVLSGFFRALSSSFTSTRAAHVGFMVNFVLVISLLFSSFSVAVGIMRNMTQNITSLLAAATPVIITVLAGSGYVAPAAAFAPVIIFITGFLTMFVDWILTPIIIMAAILHLISYLADKDTFEPLTDSVKKGIVFSLKSVSLIFTAVIGIQRVASPIVNNLAIRGTRTVVGAVPVVGGALSGAIDTAMVYGSAIRGAVSVALLIGALGMALGPIISIAAFMLVYKITAALISPISDERITKAVSTAGDYAGILLAVCAMVGFMFVLIVMAVLTL